MGLVPIRQKVSKSNHPAIADYKVTINLAHQGTAALEPTFLGKLFPVSLMDF
jgi:hypothetical protein